MYLNLDVDDKKALSPAPYYDDSSVILTPDTEQSAQLSFEPRTKSLLSKITSRQVLQRLIKLILFLIVAVSSAFLSLYALQKNNMVIIYHDRPSNPSPTVSNDPPPYTPAEPTSSSRETIIHRISSTISGSYDLLDLLKLSTVSATINVSVNPKKPHGTSIAKFVASTTSGTIQARFPSSANDVPTRDYHTTVDTLSGSIGGTYVLGSATSFRSNSGTINLSLTPVTGNFGTELVTHTMSGGQNIDILSGDSNAVEHLVARCGSSSGSITIRVPSDFSGTITGKSTSGSVRIRGKGVTITKDERWGSGKRIEARKGDGKGSISAETMSGSVDIEIGQASLLPCLWLEITEDLEIPYLRNTSGAQQ